MKALIASEEEWIERIKRSDPLAEKKWGYVLLGLYIIVMTLGIIAGMNELSYAIIIILGAHLFALMGMIKLNNYRLYGIINSLLEEDRIRQNTINRPNEA